MTPALDSQSLAADPSVDPVVLVVMLVAFLIGAVGPFALCVLGSIRDERAMRRYAAASEAAPPLPVGIPAEPIVPLATVTLAPAAPGVDGMDPANDDRIGLPARRAGAGG